MKKIISLLLTLVFIISVVSITAFADDNGVKIKLNGEMKTLVAYNIKDNNYFKLRDIANLLKGTTAEFDVIWNEEKGAIEILSNTPYSTNEALTNQILKNPVAKSSYVHIYKDGAQILLGAYEIADNNYFKLRDVASAINFGVDWNEVEEIIEINTNKGYEFPTSSNFGLNTKYLSLIGKTKAEVDSILGSGPATSNSMGTIKYDIGVMVGWSGSWSSTTPVPDHEIATIVYVPLEKLFFNCPQEVPVDMIKAQFNSWYDGSGAFYVNYCGKIIRFITNNNSTISCKFNADLSVRNTYPEPKVETIQIKNQ